jgi:hypothetical protein
MKFLSCLIVGLLAAASAEAKLLKLTDYQIRFQKQEEPLSLRGEIFLCSGEAMAQDIRFGPEFVRQNCVRQSLDGNSKSPIFISDLVKSVLKTKPSLDISTSFLVIPVPGGLFSWNNKVFAAIELNKLGSSQSPMVYLGIPPNTENVLASISPVFDHQAYDGSLNVPRGVLKRMPLINAMLGRTFHTPLKIEDYLRIELLYFNHKKDVLWDSIAKMELTDLLFTSDKIRQSVTALPSYSAITAAPLAELVANYIQLCRLRLEDAQDLLEVEKQQEIARHREYYRHHQIYPASAAERLAEYDLSRRKAEDTIRVLETVVGAGSLLGREINRRMH